jgi:hypothetical protein
MMPIERRSGAVFLLFVLFGNFGVPPDITHIAVIGAVLVFTLALIAQLDFYGRSNTATTGHEHFKLFGLFDRPSRLLGQSSASTFMPCLATIAFRRARLAIGVALVKICVGLLPVLRTGKAVASHTPSSIPVLRRSTAPPTKLLDGLLDVRHCGLHYLPVLIAVPSASVVPVDMYGWRWGVLWGCRIGFRRFIQGLELGF